ncbi:hypothetical protein [Deinococcus multiflagellatus]|uniref:Uncharacterized protein n=1 Tax=Deinococcus multiflagellatus TaxID=1656887 RepID=A0ABW1ZP95_9DEIO
MTDQEQVQLIRHMRAQALQGVSGTALARSLLARPELHRFTAYGLFMDAFGMTLREARSAEYLLADEREGPVEALEEDWAPFLRHPDLWPRRIVRVEIQGREDTQALVTLRLFEYENASQDEAVLVDWGDGTRSESRTPCCRCHTCTKSRASMTSSAGSQVFSGH